VLTDLGWRDEVRAVGDDWLQRFPRSADAYREYALALKRTGAGLEAESVLQRGIDVSAGNVELTSALADLYLEQGRWPAAAEQWSHVAERAPGLAWTLVNYKLESLGSNTSRAAQAVLAQLDGREGVESRKLAAIVAVYAERPDDARRRADALLKEMEPGERQAYITQFAQVASGRGQPALVAWAYRHLLYETQEDSLRWQLAREIVRYDLSAGDTASAVTIVREVATSVESGTDAHRWASAVWIELAAGRGDAKRATARLIEHALLYPNDPALSGLALVVADANARHGELEDADRVLGLLAERPIPAELSARLSATRAYLALQAGRFEEARVDLEAAAALLNGAQRGEALRFLGFLRKATDSELQLVAEARRLAQQGESREAFQGLVEGLDRTAPSEARPGILLWAGELAIQVTALDWAEGVLWEIPRRYPRSGETPVALMTLADVLAENGRKDDAIGMLEKLILEYPESALTPLGRRRLAELKAEVPRS
jgi:predicted Zn-dependent protease